MRPTRTLGVAAIVLCGVLVFLLGQRQTAPHQSADAVRNQAHPTRAATPTLVAVAPAQTPPPSRQPAGPAAPTVGNSKAPAPSPQNAQTTPPKKAKDPIKDPIKDPLAREALAWVGFDPAAEAYWIDAINDPTLSAQERQDLIEDLNEDGLFDPNHPTLEDLPVIVNRLELIEGLAPGAMDQVNADAFEEAHKDLLNLAAVAVGGGQSVK